MNNTIYRLLLFLTLLLSIQSLASQVQESSIPRKVLLLKPDLIIKDSIESIIFAHAQSTLEKMTIAGEVNYAPEHKWKKYSRFLDFDQSAVLVDFYKKTGITGSINLFVEENTTYYIVSVITFDFVSREKKLQKIYLVKEQIVDELSFFTISFKSLITGCFPPDSVENLRKRKYIPPPFVRHYHDFELIVSGGGGFHVSNPNINTAVEVFSFGVSPYVGLEATLKRFRLRLHSSFSFIFNYSLYTNEDKSNYSGYRDDDNLFLWNTFITLDASGWLKNRIVAIGGGAGVEKKSFNLRDITRATSPNGGIEKTYSDYYQRTLFLTFVYFHLAIQPYPDMLIYNDLGLFICPQNISSLTPAPQFAPYFRFGFRYIFYKNLFFELNLPFYIFRFVTDEEESNPSRPLAALYFGLGWRFEWSQK